MMIKELVHPEDILIETISVPNIGPPKYIKQIVIDIKGETGSKTKW